MINCGCCCLGDKCVEFVTGDAAAVAAQQAVRHCVDRWPRMLAVNDGCCRKLGRDIVSKLRMRL